MAFSLHDILAASRNGYARLTAETAGFLALAAAEQLQRRSGGFEPDGVWLEAAGSLTFDRRIEGEADQAETALRSWLGRTLAHASTDNPALEQVAAAPRGGIEMLQQELATALIPLNRSAARRGLCRLYRRLQELQADAFQSPAQPPVAPVAHVAGAPSSNGPMPTHDPTPIFGSLRVRPRPDGLDRQPTPPPPGADTDPDQVPEAAAAYVPAWTPKPPVGEVRPEPSFVIDDCESVIESVPEARQSAPPIFDRYAPQRSDVSQLLGQFAVSDSGDAHAVSARLQSSLGVDAGGLTPQGPSTASRTPPPVQYEQAAPEGGGGSSRAAGWLMAPAVLLLGLGGWFFRPAADLTGGAASAASCAARVEVRAADGAEVRLVSASRKARRTGPTARFADVLCDEDAEVIVLLPEAAERADGQRPPGGWLRVPVPAERLRTAAESGEPLVVSVFGR